jgi:hypothetical protein
MGFLAKLFGFEKPRSFAERYPHLSHALDATAEKPAPKAPKAVKPQPKPVKVRKITPTEQAWAGVESDEGSDDTANIVLQTALALEVLNDSASRESAEEFQGEGGSFGGGGASGEWVPELVPVPEATPAPEPAYQAPEPTYSAPEPSYSAPEPSYSAPDTSSDYSSSSNDSGSSFSGD